MADIDHLAPSFLAAICRQEWGLMKALPSSSGKMQLEGEFVTVPRKLYNHLRQAHSLLGKRLAHVCESGKCIQLAKQEELRTMIAAWTRLGLFRACFEPARNGLF